MSPTSYQTAPPRNIRLAIIETTLRWVKEGRDIARFFLPTSAIGIVLLELLLYRPTYRIGKLGDGAEGGT